MTLKNRDTFADRLENAAKARQALLEQARAKDTSNDPEFVARQEARAAAARAREERETERRNAEDRARAMPSAPSRKLRGRRQRPSGRPRKPRRPWPRPKMRRSAPCASQIELLAAQKATRDARYAARKARKK